MTTYGVTPEGFVVKPLQATKGEIEDEMRGSISQAINLTEDSVEGIFVGIICTKLTELWEALHAVYRADDPDQSTGDALDAVSSLSGTLRREATKSSILALCTTDGTVTIQAGKVVSVEGTGARFQLVVDATSTAAAAWAATTAYAVGNLVAADGNVYYCTGAGTSGPTGPTGTETAIVDGSVTWRCVGEGDSYVYVIAQAEETGPTTANAWTATKIETPVTGWKGVANPLDADMGRDVELDSSLRERREDELQADGSSSVSALRANILRVDAVKECVVFENITSSVDAEGLPAHTFEPIVLGGDNDDIAQAIWDKRAGGCPAHGSTSGTATDVEGNIHTELFSRPIEVPIYITVVGTIDSKLYPTDGDTKLKEALAAFGDNNKGIGADVIYAYLYSIIFTIQGITDVTSLAIGTTASPTGEANIPIDSRSISQWDTSYIQVTMT